MSEQPRSTILQKYHNAISALPGDQQTERMEKIKSPKTLRRFLSAEAPLQLAARFGYRLNEVMNQGLSSYETGRVLLTQGKTDEAKERFARAVKAGDKRGHHGLGDIECLNNTEESDKKAVQHFQQSLKIESTKHESHLTLGLVFYRMEDDAQANAHFEKAAEAAQNPDAVRACTRGKILLTESALKKDAGAQDGIIVKAGTFSTSKEEKEGLALLEPLAEKGNVHAIDTLVGYYFNAGQINKVAKYFLLAAQYGFTSAYKKLGDLYLSADHKKEALEAYRMALRFGHTGAITHFTDLLIELEKDIKGAEEASRKAIEKGEPMAYAALANVLAYQGRTDEAMHTIYEAHRQGTALPPAIIIPVLIKEKRLKEAQKICEKNLASNPQLLLFMVLIEFEKNNSAAAFRHLENYAKQTGKIEEWKQVMAYSKQGHKAEAMYFMANMFMEAFAGLGFPPEQVEAMLSKIVGQRMN